MVSDETVEVNATFLDESPHTALANLSAGTLQLGQRIRDRAPFGQALDPAGNLYLDGFRRALAHGRDCVDDSS